MVDESLLLGRSQGTVGWRHGHEGRPSVGAPLTARGEHVVEGRVGSHINLEPLVLVAEVGREDVECHMLESHGT